jgi:hypothetical protein
MQDIGLIITIVGTGMGLILAMVALILTVIFYGSSERKEIAQESKEFRERWAQETKEFHGRLIAIEERRNRILMGDKER